MGDYPGLDLMNLSGEILRVVKQEEVILAYIPWDVLEYAFGPILWEQFSHWMRGQTSVPGGAFPWDVERFLQGLPIID